MPQQPMFPPQEIVALCDQAWPTTKWSPGEFHLEPGLHRGALQVIAPLLRQSSTLRYTLGQRSTYDEACASICRKLERWTGGDITPLRAPAGATKNPLATVYAALVHGGARLSPTHGFGPIQLSDVEAAIVDGIYQSLAETGAWPKATAFEALLASRNLLVNLSEAVSGILPLVRGADGRSYDGHVLLTLPGLAFVPNASQTLGWIVDLARAAGKLYIRKAQSAGGERVLPLLDVLEDAGLELDSLPHLIQLVRFEPAFRMGWSHDFDPKTVNFGSSSEFIPFAQVDDFSHLVAALCPDGLFHEITDETIGISRGVSRTLVQEQEYEVIEDDLTAEASELLTKLFGWESAASGGNQNFEPAAICNLLTWKPRQINSAASLLEELALVLLTRVEGHEGPYPFAKINIKERGRIVARRLKRPHEAAASSTALANELDSDIVENDDDKRIGRPTPWVFLSAARQGLEEVRQAARDACLRARMLPVGMESWTAEPRPALEACKKHVRDCDAVVLLVGHRYGSIDPDSKKGFTQLEYEEAKKEDKPIFVFFVKSANTDAAKLDPDDLGRLQEFRQLLGNDMRGDASDVKELELLVFQALREWREDSGVRDRHASRDPGSDSLSATTATAHDLKIFRAIEQMCGEDQLFDFLSFLDSDNSFDRDTRNSLAATEEALKKERNRFLDAGIREAADALKLAIARLLVFLGQHFFHYGGVDEFALYPELNIDRNGTGREGEFERYDKYAYQLMDVTEGVRRAYRAYRQAVKQVLLV